MEIEKYTNRLKLTKNNKINKIKKVKAKLNDEILYKIDVQNNDYCTVKNPLEDILEDRSNQWTVKILNKQKQDKLSYNNSNLNNFNNNNLFHNNNQVSNDINKKYATSDNSINLSNKIRHRRNIFNLIKIDKKSKLRNLYIYICFWLFLLQRVQSRPTNIMPLDSRGTCSDKLEYLKNYTVFVYKKLLLEGLNEYTQSVFSQDHRQFHQETKTHVNDWLVPNGKHLQFSNYYDEKNFDGIPAVNVNHLFDTTISTEAHLERELQELNARLSIVRYWLKNYHDNTNNIAAKSYFKVQFDHATTLLNLNKQVLSEVLNVEPNDVNYPSNVEDKLDLIGWFATREHLNILVYANSALDKLQQLCGNTM